MKILNYCCIMIILFQAYSCIYPKSDTEQDKSLSGNISTNQDNTVQVEKPSKVDTISKSYDYSDFVTYTNINFKLKFSYPHDWDVKQGLPHPALLMAQLPVYDNPKAWFTVTLGAQEKVNESLSSVTAESYIKKNLANFAGLKVISEGWVFDQGILGKEFVFRILQDYNLYYQTYYLFNINQILYVIVFTCGSDSYRSSKESISKMINSFKLGQI